jgi:hypothetical protein
MRTSTVHSVDQLSSELEDSSTGHLNYRFALLYLEKTFLIDNTRAQSQVASAPTDIGMDGFHFDPQRRNLYLFFFHHAESIEPLKAPLKRAISSGIDSIFGDSPDEQAMSQLEVQIQSCLAENETLIERVCIHFVFTGNPREAEQSQVFNKLREDLESKKHIIDSYFGRPIILVIEFRSTRIDTAGATKKIRRTHSYPVHFRSTLSLKGPQEENMLVGFLSLNELLSIYREMGNRFFERNIRSALPTSEAVNLSIREALKRIIVDELDDPISFAFNHNGITISADSIAGSNGDLRLNGPRLLNGAQTIISFARFLDEVVVSKLPPNCQSAMSQILVLSRLITNASPAFVTTVTINNNRQNPVRAWNLHAHDMIQLELQDKFRNELGTYYERQENSFSNLSSEDILQQGIFQHKRLDILRFTRTLLVSDGQLNTLLHLPGVFENDRLYSSVFSDELLKTNLKLVLLCYKVQFFLGHLVKEVMMKAIKKYAFVSSARSLLWALLCQAILNDSRIDDLTEDFGRFLGLESAYKDWLSDMTMDKCRFILSDLAADEAYESRSADGNFAFMKTNAAYMRAMEIAQTRFAWKKKNFAPDER